MTRTQKIALVVGGLVLAGAIAYAYVVWRRKKLAPALVGDGGAMTGQERFGNPAGSRREFPVRNRNVLADLAAKGGGAGDFEEIYAEPGLRALYEWLASNSNVKLRFRSDDDATWWMGRWNVPQDVRDAYVEGAGVWVAHSSVLLHIAPGDGALSSNIVDSAVKSGRILSVATDETASRWHIMQGGLQIPVPLEDFGLMAMGGKAGFVLVKVSDVGAQAGGDSLWDKTKDAGDGLADKAANKALDMASKGASSAFEEGFKAAGLDSFL